MLNWLSASMQKWTPFSIMLLSIAGASIATVLWYVMHFQTPPDWSIAIISVVGGTSIVTGSVNAGVTIANGVAIKTAAAVVEKMPAVIAASTTGNLPPEGLTNATNK